MSVFENDGNYYSNFSVPAISFCDRKPSSDEFSQYWAKRNSVKENVPERITEELKRMPSARSAGLSYYVSLNNQLFNKFYKDIAKAKSHDPKRAQVISI